jgi:hypothetical protein
LISVSDPQRGSARQMKKMFSRRGNREQPFSLFLRLYWNFKPQDAFVGQNAQMKATLIAMAAL